MSKDIYKEQILSTIPLVLSSQDRDRTSETYGSFDREYLAWQQKTFQT